MYFKLLKFKLQHLIDNRLHIGHKQKNLEKKMNSYSFGFRHNVTILDLRKTLWSLNYLFYNLTELFYYRNNIFFVETQGNIPLKSIMDDFETNHLVLSNNFIKNSGFIQQQWIQGLLSNWKIVFDTFKNKKKSNTKQSLRWQNSLKGLKNKLNHPLLPDFLFICNINNNLGLKEVVKSKIPLMGLVDSNMNPEFFLYPFLGNNDSIESIKFCFSLLALSQKESMIQERKTLYYLVLLKIKQMLKK